MTRVGVGQFDLYRGEVGIDRPVEGSANGTRGVRQTLGAVIHPNVPADLRGSLPEKLVRLLEQPPDFRSIVLGDLTEQRPKVC